MLGGPANLLVAEKPQKQSGDPGDHMLLRPERDRLATSSDSPARITATRGPIALTVIAEGTFHGGGVCRRLTRFYHDSPRIDFETTLNDIPDRTVVVSEFPLAHDVVEVRRGIPYGFTHGAWPAPTEALPGRNQGITPAVRWCHYALQGGGGLAILDRGLSGRELTGRTPVIFLLNTTNKYYGYPNPWLSGEGRHFLEYAIVAHETPWTEARIPHMAWEYNSPPYAISAGPAKPYSFLQSSGNVIVEAIRRDGEFIEVRLAECFGQARHCPRHSGSAAPRRRAHQHGRRTMPNCSSADRVTNSPSAPSRLSRCASALAQSSAEPKPLLAWDPLVPPAKRPTLHKYSSEKGHPPRGV